MTNPSPTAQPADSRLREQLANIFEEIGSSDSDWYEAHTLAKGDVWDYIECIHLTPKAVDKLEALCQEIAREARLAAKREIIAIGRERLDNDDTYMLEAFIEDAESYLEKLTKQSAEGASDEYKQTVATSSGSALTMAAIQAAVDVIPHNNTIETVLIAPNKKMAKEWRKQYPGISVIMASDYKGYNKLLPIEPYKASSKGDSDDN